MAPGVPMCLPRPPLLQVSDSCNKISDHRSKQRAIQPSCGLKGDPSYQYQLQSRSKDKGQRKPIQRMFWGHMQGEISRGKGLGNGQIPRGPLCFPGKVLIRWQHWGDVGTELNVCLLFPEWIPHR